MNKKMETQNSMMDKIRQMEQWVKIENKSIDINPLNGKQRLERISNLNRVNEELRHGKRILKYMQRGQVFDLPECVESFFIRKVKE